MKIKIRDQRGKEAEYSIPLGMEVCGLEVTGWQDLCIIMDAAQQFVCSHMEEMAYDKNGIATESELAIIGNSSLAVAETSGVCIWVTPSSTACGMLTEGRHLYCRDHLDALRYE